MNSNFNLRLKCPACTGQENMKIQDGVISPWVIEISGLKKGFRRTELLKCGKCESAFFNVFYGDIILNSIYERYRGERYFKIRNSWDKSYTEKLNQGLSSDLGWMEWRRNAVEEALAECGIGLEQTINCVDIGGGEGGVIPNFHGGKKYVLDSNSEVSLPPDTNRLANLNELIKVKPDLIMCCGLLEHLNSPMEFLNDLISASPDTSNFYFEVPCGIPSRRRFSPPAFILSLISSSKRSWQLFSYLDRIFSNWGLGSFFPLKCSEHLNFFSESGLRTMMEAHQLEVILLKTFSTNHNLPDSKGIAFADAWQILAKRNLQGS